MGKVSKLRNNNLKCALLNIIKTQTDKSAYIRSRLITFNGVFKLHKESLSATVQCSNLYVILYAKYFTTRFMIEELKSKEFADEDDVELKEKFNDIFKKSYVNSLELEAAYLQVIKQSKNEEDFKLFKEYNCKLKQQKLTAEEQEVFYLGACNTDIFLEEKLQVDVDKYVSCKEKFVWFLQRHQYVNVCITAAGVVILSTIGQSGLGGWL